MLLSARDPSTILPFAVSMTETPLSYFETTTSVKQRIGLVLILVTTIFGGFQLLVRYFVLGRYRFQQPNQTVPSWPADPAHLPLASEDETGDSAIWSVTSLPISIKRQGFRSQAFRSPSPEAGANTSFDSRLFYHNLNNSSQYLRRDSFVE